MGKKRSKRWNSCLVCFIASLGALCLSFPGLRAEGDSEANNGFTGSATTVTADQLDGNR